MPDNGTPNPLEILDTEPQVETKQVEGLPGVPSEEPKPEESEDEKGQPSFAGILQVTFPDTEIQWPFRPVETTRGKMENRWKYPSPIPQVHDLCKSPQEKLAKYAELLGMDGLVDLAEDSIARNCQAKWKQAAEAAPSPDKVSELFASIFHEGKQREAITSAGLDRKANELRKELMKEKTAGNMDKARELAKQITELTTKAIEMKYAEMAAMEAEFLGEEAAPKA